MTDDRFDLLHAYSEWLDGQSLMRDEHSSADDRSHDQLVSDFLAERLS